MVNIEKILKLKSLLYSEFDPSHQIRVKRIAPIVIAIVGGIIVTIVAGAGVGGKDFIFSYYIYCYPLIFILSKL